MNVLYADDDPEDREFFSDALSWIDNSIECTLATDGVQALRLLEEIQTKPDFIFLDVNMPLLDGKGCLEKIRLNEKWHDIPVIMFSSVTDDFSKERYLKLGATYSMVKPSRFTDLQQALDQIFKTFKK